MSIRPSVLRYVETVMMDLSPVSGKVRPIASVYTLKIIHVILLQPRPLLIQLVVHCMKS